jgi:hypothetical protein
MWEWGETRDEQFSFGMHRQYRIFNSESLNAWVAQLLHNEEDRYELRETLAEFPNGPDGRGLRNARKYVEELDALDTAWLTNAGRLA